MKTAVVIQGRIKSGRLPRKILSPLTDGNIIQHCMRALKSVEVEEHILLCDYYSFKELKPFAEEEEYKLFCGPVDDVLKRFALCIRYFGINSVIRGNGDNPLVSSEIANEAMIRFKKTKADYFRFDGEPKGAGVEVINSSFIFLTEEICDDVYDREHVGRGFVEHNTSFSSIKYIKEPIPEKWAGPDIRITVDTEDDYKQMKKIYDDLYEGEPIKIERVIEWFKK